MTAIMLFWLTCPPARQLHSCMAAGLRSSFPEIQLALVVGICSVVPVHIKTQEEIVLGDISTAVVQYDFGRQYPDGFRRKKTV